MTCIKLKGGTRLYLKKAALQNEEFIKQLRKLEESKPDKTQKPSDWCNISAKKKDKL